MKKISFWAKSHKQAARIIIVVSFILLIAAAYVTGTLIKELGIAIPAFLLVLILSMYFIALLCYPSHSRKVAIGANKFYRWQKTCDVVLTASAFFIMLYASNHQLKIFQPLPVSSAFASSSTSLPGDSSQRSYRSIAAFAASLKTETGEKLKWTERKKLLKEQVKAIKKADSLSKNGKAGLIILAVIAALGLLFLVALLSCSVACAGSGAAALIVGLGGAGLVIFLLIKSIRSINKKKMTPKEEEPAKTD